MHFAGRARVAAAVATVFVASSIALAGPSGAQGGLVVTFPGGLFQGEELAAVGTLSSPCDGPITAGQVSFEFNGDPTDLVTVGDFTTNSFSFVIPDELATEPAPAETALLVKVNCTNAAAPVERSSTIGWAQIQVTKTVVGDGPLGASYPMAVDCESNMGDLADFEFELADGESWSVFAVTAGGCGIEELDDLGARSTEYVGSEPSPQYPASVIMTSLSLFPVEVINTFPVTPPTPPTPPGPEPTPEPTPVVVPTFTG